MLLRSLEKPVNSYKSRIYVMLCSETVLRQSETMARRLSNLGHGYLTPIWETAVIPESNRSSIVPVSLSSRLPILEKWPMLVKVI